MCYAKYFEIIGLLSIFEFDWKKSAESIGTVDLFAA